MGKNRIGMEKAMMEVLAAQKAARQLCFRVQNGAYPIELRQRKKDNFTVIYGLQVKENLNYARAAEELGACIMHCMACEGVLDNG